MRLSRRHGAFHLSRKDDFPCVIRDNRLEELRGRKRGRAEGSAGATSSEIEHVNFFANEEYALATNRRTAVVERNVDESFRLGGKHASGNTAWYARDGRQMSNPLMEGVGLDRRNGVDVRTGANKQGAKRRRKKVSLSALRDERLKREARERRRESEKLAYAKEGRDLMG